jgi:hypothetical protein
MKKVVFLLMLFVCSLAILLITGCCCSEPKGFVQDKRLGHTSYGACAREYRSINFNGQMAWDDFDYFWMIDRPSKLSWLRTRDTSSR